MTNLDESLARIDAATRLLGRDRLHEALYPGVVESEFRARLQRVRLAPGHDLTELYRWHDGTYAPIGFPVDDVQLFPGYYMLSSTKSVETIEILRRVAEWDPTWFPILKDAGGWYFVQQISDGGDGPVIFFMPSYGEIALVYASVADMFHTIAEAYDRAIIFVDAEGYLEMDDDQYRALARELNPGIEYWQ